MLGMVVGDKDSNKARSCLLLLLIIALSCLVAVILGGCDTISNLPGSSTEASLEPTYTLTTELRATPTSIPTSTLTPTPTLTRPRYSFHVELDYWNHQLDVQQYLEYTNATGQALDEIVFNVPFNHHQGVFSLREVSLKLGTERLNPAYSLEDTVLSIVLSRPLGVNERLTLFFDYSLFPRPMILDSMLSGGRPGWSEDAVNMGYWYPVLAPYVPGEGWFTFSYHHIGDLYVAEVADYQAEIVAPADVIVVGPGNEEREGNVWRYSISQARTFAFCASHRYQCSSLESNGVTFSSCYLPEHEAAGRLVLDTSIAAVHLFEQLFGRYPYETFAIGETNFTGGAEFSGLVIYGSRMYHVYLYGPQGQGIRTALYTLVPHETSHQWWYGVVGNNQIIEPWLDEALAKYCEQLFYEKLHPEHAQWRWEWMGNNTREPGPIDLSIYDFSNEERYEADVYLRGALFLDDLRRTIGDEGFFAFLQDYYQSQAYELSTAEDFFAILSRHTTEDLSPLLELYFSR